MGNRVYYEKFMSEDDFQYYLDLVLNEKVMVMNYGRVFTMEEASQSYRGILKINKRHEAFGYFKAFENASNNYIGLGAMCINDDMTEGDIEYMLLPEYWGQGYGSEIAEELLKMAEGTKSHLKITAYMDPANTGSKKILLKNGFVSCELSENPDDGSTVEMFVKEIVDGRQ